MLLQFQRLTQSNAPYPLLSLLLSTMVSLIFLFFSAFLFTSTGVASDNGSKNQNHIVYMGSTDTSGSKQVLNQLVQQRNEGGIVRVYQHGFHGFAAPMSEAEASELAMHPGVVSVFPDPSYQLQTTQSWDFLEAQTSSLSYRPATSTVFSSKGSDTIIGIFDTGIWPESESFKDSTLGPVPSRWKGECMEGPDFKSSSCNRKLIGARYYIKSWPEVPSPRDTFGHGTHVASTAAGIPVHNVSYYGVAAGTARGGVPASRIAMYSVCNFIHCSGSAILAAFDDAIKDGVDVLSLSIGNDHPMAFLKDPIVIGALHAVQKGITVICAAGNSGPSPQSIFNYAPWIITVGATTIDRFFESKVILGNQKVIKGEGINFSLLKKSPIYELVDGSEHESRVCLPESQQDQNRVKGKIVLCNFDNETNINIDQLESDGAVGVIGIVNKLDSDAPISTSLPVTTILSEDGLTISNYIKSSRNPSATILATRTILFHKPAPVIPNFSSRGPAPDFPNLIKPDIVAPGVQILASWIGNDTDIALPGKEAPRFNIISGTSMACPHVSGIVSAIKSQNPTWTPAVIRSAIMTTAIQTNNLNEPISTEIGEMATPYDFGAGLVSKTKGLRPGLVYEMAYVDYFKFLCYVGYNLTSIKLVAGKLPKGFSCGIGSNSSDLISNLNYPSIFISGRFGHPLTVQRTLTNMCSGDERVYTSSVEAPPGLAVLVVPKQLKFTNHHKRVSYSVTFSSSPPFVMKNDTFGAITWTSGKNKVRTPFAVKNLLM